MILHDTVSRMALIDQIQRAEDPRKLLTSFNRHPSSATDLFLIFISPGGNTAERAKLPGSPASKSRGVSSRHSRSPRASASTVSSIHKPTRFPIATNITILCSRKQGQHRRNTIEKANRDEHYASLLASMQNNSGPKPAVKSAATR